MLSPDENPVSMNEHAQMRLGLLTSSTAHVIMHSSVRGWKSLSKKLWTERAEDFTRKLTAATEYGHAHEAEGAAKFWQSHPWVSGMLENQFFTSLLGGTVGAGSSPDRVLTSGDGMAHHQVGVWGHKFGLEIKSPTGEKHFDSHNLKAHWDQVQHGLLVTGFDAWFLLVHLGDRTAAWDWIKPDLEWQRTYVKRARAFMNYHLTGKLP